MPILRETSRVAPDETVSAQLWTETPAETEEVLVVDARAHVTPSQAVERKLHSLLTGRPVPFSRLLLTDMPRQGGQH